MRKSLVILPNNLGDVLMATPALEGLKAKFPGCSTHFLVETGFEAGVQNNPHCDEIILFPRKIIRDLCRSSRWEGAFGELRGRIEAIVRTRYDAILNLCQHDFMSYLVPLMMGAATAGRRFLKEGNHAVDDPWSQYLYAIPFSRTSNGLHAADVYRRIAAVKEHRGGYSLVTTEGEKDRAKRFLAQKGLASTDRLMVFQPGAAFPSKRWPVEHYIELGRLLVGSGWRIVVTGGPSDKEIASSIEKGVGQDCFAVAGETNFRQSIALCELARGCVCGDTALMHAACALNVPTYALFGPTNPVETGPYGGGNWVFSSHCPERPCFKTNCDACGCMRSILPRAVFSCIETGNPGENPECDVFKTELEKDGDFSLQPIAGRPHPYVNAANAYFTLKAFEPGLPEPVLNAQEKDASIHETMLWLDCVETMKNSLRNFLLMRSSSFVGDFERGKRELSRFKGIGEFWTAVLNLRLNSVPLLNPLEGIERSIEVCHATLRQVGNAVKAAPDGEIRSGS